jgi:hypothetical protein
MSGTSRRRDSRWSLSNVATIVGILAVLATVVTAYVHDHDRIDMLEKTIDDLKNRVGYLECPSTYNIVTGRCTPASPPQPVNPHP